ncbi:hypothetical protein MSG28_003535 [Choristoneura fumiferana]|uniref:Uncharacterized protein n=1 Tax=Choristoneura fumiferana TaxID=7141 RepID=A0ACC0KF66_CHOFU|nr:hypothetical protein MSG28_003535 [Choristoneura fumiferana]
MVLAEFRGFVSGLAVVTTVLQFLSGILVCKQYVVNRTTAEASPLPFIAGVLSTGLWLMYGLSKNDSVIVTVNVIGITLMTAYTALFYVFTYKKSTTLKQILVTVGVLFFMLGYVRVEENSEILLSRLGTSACVLTLVAIAAPMSKLLYVLRMRCTECLPFPMILMSFVVSSLWFLYGLIEEDTFLTVPNIIGAVLALLQLSLFVVFPRTPGSPLLAKSLQA